MNQLSEQLQHWIKVAFGISIAEGTTYWIYAGIAWVLGYVLLRRVLARRKVMPGFPDRVDLWREIRYSMLTVMIYGLVAAVTLWMTEHGWTQLYGLHGRADGHYSGAWFLISIVLTIVLHDTYFYWTHRLMHHRALFRWFHRTHHRSHNPSPWTSYAFDPLEALVQAGIFPLAVCLYPMHAGAFGLFMLWQIFFNVLGHSGYETYPRWLMDSWLGKVLNTTTNHVMHHEFTRGNYGLYFNVWDRIMGTNHERYEERYRKVTARPG
jgi:sterol desaturase/sphingolipid hydroxylase (fatty acid hydroxylase superfamily)